MSLVQQYLDQENLNHTEGARGFSALCRLAAALGYRDPLYQGALRQGGRTGDLMVFFEDNPGAITAVIDWIEENEECWADDLESSLDVKEEEDE